jgi:hypothetical protein
VVAGQDHRPAVRYVLPAFDHGPPEEPDERGHHQFDHPEEHVASGPLE